MKHWRQPCAFASAILAGLAVATMATVAQLGDAGHFIDQFMPEVFLNNPEGRAGTITVHRYIWPEAAFNAGFFFDLSGPDGKALPRVEMPADVGSTNLTIPAGAPGVYKLGGGLTGYGLCWFESSLEQMVVACEDIGPVPEKVPALRAFLLHAIAPRRWYFYVPPGTRSFEIQTLIGTWQSHREDYGFLVMNPRGQRVAALYGGLSVHKAPLKIPETVSQTIETDAGTAGRFWSLWITGGDSHCYSDFRLVLKGVPPYVAPSPEQWFDPSSGKAPPRLVYDESQIRTIEEQAPADPRTGNRRSTDHYLWAPAPFLGDEDYNGIRGRATVYLDNPENRPIDFGAGTYLPPGDGKMPIRYTLFDPQGRQVFAQDKVFIFQKDYRVTIPSSFPGVYRMDVDAATWYGWSEPAVPMVLEGRATRKGSLFQLQLSVARHWFFRVPVGTKRFRVGAVVADPAHVLALEVHAPDRQMEGVFVRGGRPQTLEIEVPPGLAGKIWFLRTDVASPTRFVSEDPRRPTPVRIDADLTLSGVPGYLAPTWEQWFDPRPAPVRRP